MRLLQDLFTQNALWAEKKVQEDKDFFTRLASQQTPEYLWIGCADSRVPANQVCNMQPGEFFTHRNIANMVHHTDINCLSVIQYAIEVLEVKHIIVCGHYGCGGIKAAMGNKESGLIDHWLRSLKDLYIANQARIDSIEDPEERANFLCEQNVRQQVTNICHSSFVQNAWRNNKDLTVHGWVYDINIGRLVDLNVCYDAAEQVPDIYNLYP